MEISARDKKLLVYLIAISIIAGSYFFVAKPLLDKQAKLNEEISVTGGYELCRKWFPYSRVYHSSDTGASPLERATKDMIGFLRAKNYLEVEVNVEEQEEIMTYVHSLIYKGRL